MVIESLLKFLEIVRNIEIYSNEVPGSIDGFYLETKKLDNKDTEIKEQIIIEPNEAVLRKKKLVLIITALEKELKPLIDMIAFPLSLGMIKIDNNQFYTLDVTSECTLIATTFKKMGTVAAALSMQSILNQFNVCSVILTGICGGLRRGELEIGDIIVSDQIINYDIAKLNDDSNDIRWEVYRSNDHLRRGLLSNDSSRWREYIKSIFPDVNRMPKIYSGTILSGNKVFASRIEIEELLFTWRKALAVEMEAAGIAAALHTHKNPPSFVMVKSVCDFADSTKGDDWQDFAASVAASFVIDYVFSYPNVI